MRRADNLSEWQLQAVLFKAKLTQYFEIFISQGGDDIDQIMQCDEHEFLEIMSLVGMASKPLHVRRLQRTLNEFSLNRAQFLLSTIAFIGLPPMDLTCSTSATDNLAAALKFLIPGFLPAQLNTSCFGLLRGISSSNSNVSLDTSTSRQNDSEVNQYNVNRNDSPIEMPLSNTTSSSLPLTSSKINNICNLTKSQTQSVPVISATANVLPFPDNVLMSLVNASSNNILTVTPPITTTETLTTLTNIINSNLSELNKTNNLSDLTSTNSPPSSVVSSLSQIIQQSSKLPSQSFSECSNAGTSTASLLSSNILTEDFNLLSGDSNANNLTEKNSKVDSNNSSPIISASFQSLSPSSNFINSITPSTSLNLNTTNSSTSSTLGQQFEMPTLAETDIQQLKEFAHILIDKLPKIEPRFVQNKKKIHKELVDAMFLAPNHPDRLTKFRQFSAIYGRFDTKRKPNKPLTFHEALVNEAAAQLCLCRPELLTRRDELFPLARKLVRIAGFRGLGSSIRSYQHSDSESAYNECNLRTETKNSDHSRTPSRSSVQSLSSSLSPSPSLKSGNESGNGIEENEESKICLDINTFTTTNFLQTNATNNNLFNSKFCLNDSNLNFNEKNDESSCTSPSHAKKRRNENDSTFNAEQFFEEQNQKDLATTTTTSTSLNTTTNIQ